MSVFYSKSTQNFAFIGYVILTLSLIFLAKWHDISIYIAIGSVSLILIGDRILSHKPELIAIFFSKRGMIANILFAITISGCIILIMYFNSPIPKITSTFMLFLFQFIIQGIVVGIVLRTLFGLVAIRVLLDTSEDIHKFLLLLGHIVFLWLFPFGETHKDYAAFYVFGIGLGFFLHFTVRSLIHSRAQQNRRGQTMLRLLDEKERITDFSRQEQTAIILFAKQKWKKLEKLLLNEKSSLSTILILLKATILRSRGDYLLALDCIDVVLRNAKGESTLNSHLYLFQSLIHGELKDHEDEMFKTLEKALERNKNCILARTTFSLRKAEKLKLEKQNVEKSEEPLNEIWKALKLNKNEMSPELLELVIGSSIPVTWTFLLDAYGYALLKSGDYRFSRSLLIQCILEDTSFSSPYLHLAEWYISRRIDYENDKLTERQLQLAKLCLKAAIQLEGKKYSRIKKRASEILDKLNNGEFN